MLHSGPNRASHCRASSQQRESSGQPVGVVQRPQAAQAQVHVSAPVTRHRGHGRGVRLQRHAGVGKVYVREQVVQGVPASGRGQADQRRVATLGKHSHGRHLSRLGLLVLPGGPQGGFSVRSASGIGKDLAVRRGRILHQNSLLVTRRLSTGIVIHWMKGS